MLSLNFELVLFPAIFKGFLTSLFHFSHLFSRAVETDLSLAAAVVTATLLVSAILGWVISTPNVVRTNIRRSDRHHFRLKGREGQTIGSLKMNQHQDIERFIDDLTALNQLGRIGQQGAGARLEVSELNCSLPETKESSNQYSPFNGRLCTETGCVPVQGLAKLRCRKDMIFPEVEFDSKIGKFRVELPQIPRQKTTMSGQRSFQFNVDIGTLRSQTEM
jgi:hypothetical protein